MTKMHRLGEDHLFPRAHLVLAGTVALATALPLLFWPSHDVSAQSDAAPASGHSIVIDIPLDRAAPTRPELQESATVDSRKAAQPVQLALLDSDKTTAARATSQQRVDDTASRAGKSAPQAVHTEAAKHSSATSIDTSGPGWAHTTIRSGDNLSLALGRLGLGGRDVHEVVHADKLGREFLRLRPGENIALRKNDQGKLAEMLYRRSQLESIHVVRAADGLQIEHIQREPERMTTHAVGRIDNSLFVDASKSGLSDNMIMKLAELFGWDVDFALDIRKGDSFSVLYEEHFLDGRKISDGDILAARFINQGQTYTAIRYTDSKGNTSYFAPDGKNIRKAFIRTPVAIARISSRFNLRRRHPVLHTVRAHKGVDYAAARGTPVKATGDGKVIHAGRKGGYGRAVIIQHGETYSTLYAHLNGYRKGIRRGARVKQGQVIGYIGSSGLATGPHLHYEFRVNGVHRNPLTVRFPAAEPIPAAEKQRFAKASEALLARLDDLTGSSPQLALNQ